MLRKIRWLWKFLIFFQVSNGFISISKSMKERDLPLSQNTSLYFSFDTFFGENWFKALKIFFQYLKLIMSIVHLISFWSKLVFQNLNWKLSENVKNSCPLMQSLEKGYLFIAFEYFWLDIAVFYTEKSILSCILSYHGMK